MESWSNVEKDDDAYIQWIEYSLLRGVREMTLLRHGCTFIADWLEAKTNESARLTLKRIGNTQSLDFQKYENININGR